MATHNIVITGIAHRDVHTIAASLTGVPPTPRFDREGRSVMIAPDIIMAVFVRTPEMPVWWCESVEIGGARLRENGSPILGDRREQVYAMSDDKPSWITRVVDVLVEQLPR